MTVNDYLARRDAAGWETFIASRPSVACVQQGMQHHERRAAYACDITYATAKRDRLRFLRDQLAFTQRAGAPSVRRAVSMKPIPF